MKNKIQDILLKHNVKNISFDSRQIRKNDAFFAIKGTNSDGNKYINDALNTGASIVFTDNASKQNDRIIYIENIRKALALAAEILYPKSPRNIIAVTGTNGKSSVVSYVHQILSLLRHSSATIGTLGIEASCSVDKEFNWGGSLTSADPVKFRQILNILAKKEIDNVSFEASSHGIDQYRLGDIKANTAAFVSFSQDHLDYHKSMDQYLQAKLTLFSRNLSSDGKVVINSEMMRVDYIKDFFKKHGIAYSSVGKGGDIAITRCDTSIDGQKIEFKFANKDYRFATDIIGSFQATNILIALRLVYNLGINFESIIHVLPKLKSVTGRLDRITNADYKYQIFVDYAHTPDALERSLLELKNIKKSSGRLFVIFGCGGNRDTTKRPLMGKIASEIADHVVVTDDNPRAEDGSTIRSQIIKGMKSCAIEIEDRTEAISDIIAKMKNDDILLIAGKGHEDYQIIGNKMIKSSDIEIVKKSLVFPGSKHDRVKK